MRGVFSFSGAGGGGAALRQSGPAAGTVPDGAPAATLGAAAQSAPRGAAAAGGPAPQASGSGSSAEPARSEARPDVHNPFSFEGGCLDYQGVEHLCCDLRRSCAGPRRGAAAAARPAPALAKAPGSGSKVGVSAHLGLLLTSTGVSAPWVQKT